MPVIDLQRRLQECGRIRIGQQVPSGKGTRPARLETFRLTSPDRSRIENAARLYGGKVEAWTAPAGEQWEVITETNKLPVIVPPASMAFSQWLELWSGGGCLRRCTGSPIAIDAEQLTDGPCICEQEGQRQCEYHSRLSVMLRDMTGLGLWRLDTQGFYAAIELAGAVDIISQAAGHGHLLPAVLRLEQRVQRRPGEPTRRFPVPVLDIQATPAQILGQGNNGRELEAGLRYQTVEDVLASGDPEIAILEANRERHQAEAERRGNVRPIPADSPAHWPVGSIAQQAGIAEAPEGPPAPSSSRRRKQPIPATGVTPRTRAQYEAERSGAPAEPEKPAPRKRASRKSQPSADQRPVKKTLDAGQRQGQDPSFQGSSDLSGPAAGTTYPPGVHLPGSPEYEQARAAKWEARNREDAERGLLGDDDDAERDLAYREAEYERTGNDPGPAQKFREPDEAQSLWDQGLGTGRPAETVSVHLGDADTALITKPQLTKLHVLLQEAGLGNRDAGLDWLADAIGHELDSSKQLTKQEAIRVIDILEHEGDDPPREPPDER